MREYGIDDLEHFLDELMREYDEFPEEVHEGVSMFVEEILSEEVPEGPSGDLRASIQILRDGNHIRIAPMADYAVFVLRGTNPSLGRYVPELGARISAWRSGAGVHPGTPSNPFFERTINRLSAEIDSKIMDMLDEFEETLGR